MPAALDGLGIMMSIAKPRGCHGRLSGRTPPMLLISGNAAVMLRAARIVLTCRPRSGAISATRRRGASVVATRHLAARDAGAVSPALACTADSAHADAVGAAAASCTQHPAASSATESASP